jgi:hypothetical protein
LFWQLASHAEQQGGVTICTFVWWTCVRDITPFWIALLQKGMKLLTVRAEDLIAQFHGQTFFLVLSVL